MKTNFIILARGKNALENGSFIKVYNNGDRSSFINGDFVGTSVVNDEGDAVPSDLRIFTWKLAKRYLPECCGGKK